MRSRTRFILSALIVLALAFGFAPGVAWAEDNEVEEAAEELEENVEHSEELLKKTYDEDRAEGEGRVEAAGNAYEAVLEAGREKTDK